MTETIETGQTICGYAAGLLSGACISEGPGLMVGNATTSIRKATRGDVAWLGWCTLRAYAPYVPTMGREPITMQDDFSLLLGRDQVWVMEVQADRAGLLVLRRAPSSMLIHSIAVAPSHQGYGLGSRLLEFAHQEARRQGYERITLVTNEHMRRNIGWYERMGFQETNRVAHLGSDIVHMQKTQALSISLSSRPQTLVSASGNNVPDSAESARAH